MSNKTLFLRVLVVMAIAIFGLYIYETFSKSVLVSVSELYQEAEEHERNGDTLKAYEKYIAIIENHQSSKDIAQKAQERIAIIKKEQDITKLEQHKQENISKKEKSLFANYIIWAIPAFFFLMIFEWLIAKMQKREIYRLNDAIGDLSCGMTELLSSALLKTAFFGIYTVIYEFCNKKNLLLFDIPNNVWSWIIAFIFVDFFYYWAHRFSHTTAIGWAGHCVHHQSEEYNFAVATRQGAFQSLFNFWFYLPMAVIGFHPVIYAATKSFGTLYQFWIHTRLINKMGVFEKILNTPSHHRVHHGRNEEYIDKNYAGVFIIWDHLFGSFKPEGNQVAYGVTTPLNTWNPISANIRFLWFLAKLCYRAPRLTDKFKVWLMPPGWIPEGVKFAEEERYPLFYKYNPTIPVGLSIYAAIQFVITVVLTIFLLVHEKSLHAEKYLFGSFLIFSLVNIAAIFDQKKWVIYAEVTRLYIGVVFIAYFTYYYTTCAC